MIEVYSTNFQTNGQSCLLNAESKFTMSAQYLKKEDRDEADFLHADKYQSGLQVDFNTLGTKIGYKVIL